MIVCKCGGLLVFDKESEILKCSECEKHITDLRVTWINEKIECVKECSK